MISPPQAGWISYNDTTLFNQKNNDSPYKINISNANKQVLVYEVWIPLSEFGTDSNGNFSFGVKCPLESSKSTSNGPQGGGGMSGGPGGGFGGGMPGGGPGGGMPRGGSMSRGPGNDGPGGPPQQSSSSSKTKTFWVSVHID